MIESKVSKVMKPLFELNILSTSPKEPLTYFGDAQKKEIKFQEGIRKKKFQDERIAGELELPRPAEKTKSSITTVIFIPKSEICN